VFHVRSRNKTSECNLAESKKPERSKGRIQGSRVKTMLAALFDAKNIIHH
jgi:hypothetical protein